MINISRLRPFLFMAAITSAFVTGSLPAQDQIDEQEPNHPCEQAQFIGEPALPFFIPGSLDSTGEDPDVDFYRIIGEPGQVVTITLEGQATGMGTVSDPFLGFFDETCAVLAINDDEGGTVNSKLVVTVPDSGEYVLGASVCCDYSFAGGGVGTYTLTVFQPVPIQSIAGRIVDANSGDPLPGDSDPYTYVTLYQCNDYGCYQWVNSQATGSDGTFLFSTDYMGMPLMAGAYAVEASAQWYEGSRFGPYEIQPYEAADLGDLPLAPMAMIGFITGRLVDAIHGTPLPGYAPPYAMVEIERCEEWGCYPVLGAPTDDEGVFYIEGHNYGLGPGTFRVVGRADEYYPLASEPFTLGDQESADLKDLPMWPLPIAFSEVTGCDVLPLGSTCRFAFRVTNRGPDRYRGEAWVLVRYFLQNFPYSMSSFQIGRNGAENPNPVRINLAHDKGATLDFRLEIPAAATEGTSLCVSANVGRDPDPQFDASGNRLLFCATTQTGGELQRLSYKESRRLLKELDRQSR